MIGPAPDSPRPLRVVIVEDHPVMQLGLRTLLEGEGLTVVGATATSAEAAEIVRNSDVDVVLLDLGLPDATQTDAVHRLRSSSRSVAIVVFSVERSPDVIRAALRAGANGFIAKDAPLRTVVASISAAAAGLLSVSDEDRAMLLGGGDAALAAVEERQPAPPREVERPAMPRDLSGDDATEERAVARELPLSPRELELLRFLAEGYTNKEIAAAMVLAEDTVKKGVQVLIAKLGATDRTHAVVLALRNGLIG